MKRKYFFMAVIITVASQIVSGKSLYPQEFKNYSDMPVTLYCRGDVSLLNHEKNLAIVGTRAPTHYGREVSRNLSFRLASVGVCIVSGMARGIDGAAHRGALDAEGKTIAVLLPDTGDRYLSTPMFK